MLTWLRKLINGMQQRRRNELKSENLEDVPGEEFTNRIERLVQIAWITDAPMFVDERYVERFFDAPTQANLDGRATVGRASPDYASRLAGVA